MSKQIVKLCVDGIKALPGFIVLAGGMILIVWIFGSMVLRIGS